MEDQQGGKRSLPGLRALPYGLLTGQEGAAEPRPACKQHRRADHEAF